MYINKEQTWGVITFVALEHTVDAAQHMGVGVGWDVITFAALEHIVDAAQHMGVGVGWDVITFAALEHIVDAAQHMGVGVGWDVITFAALEHIVDAAQHTGVGVGWDVITFAALEHIVDAAQHMGVGVGWHWFLLDSDESWGFTNTGSKELRALDVYKVPRAAGNKQVKTCSASLEKPWHACDAERRNKKHVERPNRMNWFRIVLGTKHCES